MFLFIYEECPPVFAIIGAVLMPYPGSPNYASHHVFMISLQALGFVPSYKSVPKNKQTANTDDKCIIKKSSRHDAIRLLSLIILYSSECRHNMYDDPPTASTPPRWAVT